MTAAQEGELRHLRGQYSVAEISRRTGVPKTTIKDFYAREGSYVPEDQGTTEEVSPNTSRLAISAKVRPLNVTVPPPVLATHSKSGIITALLYGDTHYPFQDDRALSIVGTIASWLLPSLVGHMGDLLDCYKLSRFDKDPSRMDTLQDEIDASRAHLAQMRRITPQSRFVLLEGNHEDRLRRVLWGLQGEAAVLNTLTAFKREITWPKLLDLEGLGVEYVPYGQQSRFSFLPKFLLKHGDKVRPQSAYTARAEMEGYNRSGASGHTHRLGVYNRSDYNGGHVWIETGCTCDTNPSYTADPNWQSGCIVLTFDQETGAMGVEQVKIINGRAVWRDNVITA